jgi:hypothetical protein
MSRKVGGGLDGPDGLDDLHDLAFGSVVVESWSFAELMGSAMRQT